MTRPAPVGFGVAQVLALFHATANYLDATYVEKPWTPLLALRPT